MDFETSHARREMERRDIIDKAFKKAESLIEEDEDNPRINPDDFEGVYDKATIDEDKALVVRLEKKFSQDKSPNTVETGKLAFILEAIIQEHAELSNWLGENAMTINTSKYDDYVNGVDTMVEFLPEAEEEDASHLGLAIDATFSRDAEAKFQRIKKEIDSGEMAEVKYFQSADNPDVKKAVHTPLVVIGVSADTIAELGESWLENDNKSLAKHPVQWQILEEMQIQLKVFGDYAKSKGKDDLAETYFHVLDIVNGIYEKKRESLEDSGSRDAVFNDIQSNLSIFEQ